MAVGLFVSMKRLDEQLYVCSHCSVFQIHSPPCEIRVFISSWKTYREVVACFSSNS